GVRVAVLVVLVLAGVAAGLALPLVIATADARQDAGRAVVRKQALRDRLPSCSERHCRPPVIAAHVAWDKHKKAALTSSGGWDRSGRYAWAATGRVICGCAYDYSIVTLSTYMSTLRPNSTSRTSGTGTCRCGVGWPMAPQRESCRMACASCDSCPRSGPPSIAAPTPSIILPDDRDVVRRIRHAAHPRIRKRTRQVRHQRFRQLAVAHQHRVIGSHILRQRLRLIAPRRQHLIDLVHLGGVHRLPLMRVPSLPQSPR